MAEFTIGQVARSSDVNVETVRFYERKGLIAQPDTPTGGGFRRYDEDIIKRINFIKRSQTLGFTLAEIGGLLELSANGDCDDVRHKAEAKVAEVAKKIRDLQKMKRALQDVVQACSLRNDLDPCPILTALDGQKRSRRARAS